MEDVIG
jgi:hypothetical protein